MIDQVRREIGRALAGARQALRGVVAGVVTSKRVQRLQVEGLDGEQLADVELLQQFGFTSAPPPGTQVVLVPLGGRTSACVVVATEHGSYRFQVGAAGEAALYNQWGDVIHLKADRSIRLVAQLKVRVESPLVEVVGDVTADGVSLKTHTHGGVQPGGGNTGVPN